MKRAFLCVSMVFAQEPTCNDIKKLFKRPNDLENDISCCNTPNTIFERPMEYDSAKFLDPDDLIESLRKHKKTDDVEVFVQRALNIFKAYYGDIRSETLYGMYSTNRVPFKSDPSADLPLIMGSTFDDEMHNMIITSSGPDDDCLYDIHPMTRRATGDLTIRLYVNGSYELTSTLTRRDTTTGQFLNKAGILSAAHNECTGWPSKLVDFFKPIVQYHYNDSSIDFRSIPKASITEVVPGNQLDENGLSSIRVLIYTDENISLNGPYVGFIKNTPRNDFRNRSYRVPLVDDEIESVSDYGKPGLTLKSRFANTWKDAVHVMNDIRIEAGVPPIQIISR